MSERIISESWAILKLDGTVASPGHLLLGTKLHEIPTRARAAEILHDFPSIMRGVNKCESFRIARVKLVEIEEDK